MNQIEAETRPPIDDNDLQTQMRLLRDYGNEYHLYEVAVPLLFLDEEKYRATVLDLERRLQEEPDRVLLGGIPYSLIPHNDPIKDIIRTGIKTIRDRPGTIYTWFGHHGTGQSFQEAIWNRTIEYYLQQREQSEIKGLSQILRETIMTRTVVQDPNYKTHQTIIRGLRIGLFELYLESLIPVPKKKFLS